jgi:hypothetical protein
MNLLPRYETSYNNALAIRCLKKNQKKLELAASLRDRLHQQRIGLEVCSHVCVGACVRAHVYLYEDLETFADHFQTSVK